MIFLALGISLGIGLYIVFRWIELQLFVLRWDIAATIAAADATIDRSQGRTHDSPIDA